MGKILLHILFQKLSVVAWVQLTSKAYPKAQISKSALSVLKVDMNLHTYSSLKKSLTKHTKQL